MKMEYLQGMGCILYTKSKRTPSRLVFDRHFIKFIKRFFTSKLMFGVLFASIEVDFENNFPCINMNTYLTCFFNQYSNCIDTIRTFTVCCISHTL